MRKIILVSLILLLVAACGGPAVVCNSPYMIRGQECCLDKDANSICDSDEGKGAAAAGECPALDCTTCPATTVEKTVTVTNYVCPDGRTASSQTACGAAPKTVNPFLNYTPSTTNQAGTAIESFSVRSACRDGEQGIEFHYKTGSIAESVVIEASEEPGGEWLRIYEYDGNANDKYLYALFCDGCVYTRDFAIEPGKAYLVRARFDFRALYGGFQYSNEHVVDHTEGGAYATKLC